GFVERQGTVVGDEVRLVFRADEVNDALKSLLVVDRQGGGVRGVHYETPMKGQERLAAGTINLSADHSLLDLLRALRGWRVRLVAGEGSASQEVSGRLLGIDVENRGAAPPDGPGHPSGAPTGGGSRVSLVDEASGVVTSLPLAGLRQVTLLEERAQGDLRFF